jgi:predicted metalloprotease
VLLSAHAERGLPGTRDGLPRIRLWSALRRIAWIDTMRIGRQSTNIDDRRGRRIPGGSAGLGIAGLVIAAVVALMTGNLGDVFGNIVGAGGGAAVDESPPSAQEEELKGFVAGVLASTEDVWRELLPSQGQHYEDPTLVLFRGAVESACGRQGAAVGPFYCQLDRQVYLDLGFFDELRARLGAPGDFAQAYVIAHEVGHHVQNLLGTSDQVHAAQQRFGDASANELSVRLELQADFYAGVWAHHAERTGVALQSGDIEEGLNAAAKIGDDLLQRRSQGRVVPESFTHGTSAQRVRWFKRGFETGDLAAGDTFSAREL